MGIYRAFPVSQDGHVIGPAVVIEAPSDEEAVGHAQQAADAKEQPVEVWQSARYLTRLEPAAALSGALSASTSAGG